MGSKINKSEINASKTHSPRAAGQTCLAG